ncbi:MAG: hypothetical protein IKU51_01830 [Clostridia bacterium]|nr:hypothetical protein [Clostridia bacterium]
MALNDKQKNKLRRFIRGVMIVVAVFLLLIALAVPVANNGVALGVERQLKSLPLPADTEIVESTSVAGKLVGNGNGMQYFGALLLYSECSLEELQAFYAAHQTEDGTYRVEPQVGFDIRPQGEFLMGNVTFNTDADTDGYYVLYAWGSAPRWAQDWLDLDVRGH